MFDKKEQLTFLRISNRKISVVVINMLFLRVFERRQKKLRLGCLVLFLLGLTGCASWHSSRSHFVRDGAPDGDFDVSAIADAIPKVEPVTQAGNRSPYTVLGKTYQVNFRPEGFAQTGYASWYGTKFHGNTTANGEPYDMYAMTAAHKTLPIPSYLRVTNLENNRAVVVRVNDRGPFHDGRVVDLSYVAAKKLGMLQKGTAKVFIEVITPATTGEKSTADFAQMPAANQLFLQVGAFGKKTSAENLMRQLEQQLAQAVVVRFDTDRKLFKVLVGPIPKEDHLPQIRRSLQKLEIHTTYLVQY